MKMRITVEGRTYDVEVEVLEQDGASPVISSRPAAIPKAPAPTVAPSAPRRASASSSDGGDGKQVKSPIAGMVQSVAVKAGDTVSLNDALLVLEAMKMESMVASPIAGTVKAVHAEVGTAVRMGDVLVEFE